MTEEVSKHSEGDVQSPPIDKNNAVSCLMGSTADKSREMAEVTEDSRKSR